MEASRRWPYAAWFMAVLGLVAVFSSSEAYVFYAGGRDGWVVDPAESFNHWAERNRFQVNDTIVFLHDDEVGGSVLQVMEGDFDTCSTGNPVQRLEDVAAGRSVFRFDRSGPFFFISGDEDRCQKGQKLYIIVMAVRPTKPSEAPEPAGAAGPVSSKSWSWQAFPPAGATTPPPLPPSWASAPEHAQAPGKSSLGGSGGGEMSRSSSLGAPPPTSGAAGLAGVVASVVVGKFWAGLLGVASRPGSRDGSASGIRGIAGRARGAAAAEAAVRRLMEKHHLIQVMMKSGSTHQKGNLEDSVLNHLSMENDSLEEHQASNAGTPEETRASNAGTPEVESTERMIPRLEHADEATRKAVQWELRKMKTTEWMRCTRLGMGERRHVRWRPVWKDEGGPISCVEAKIFFLSLVTVAVMFVPFGALAVHPEFLIG
uniref:Phytocyanin domain-containing protein n=1 Tax=Oryza nivara TaxID=4536 RepID=A0A0E0FT39_ORYNI